MNRGILAIVLGLALVIMPGCGLQHVAGWLAANSTDEASQPAQGPIAQQPISPQPAAPQPAARVNAPVTAPPSNAATSSPEEAIAARSEAPVAASQTNSSPATPRRSQPMAPAPSVSPVSLPVDSGSQAGLRYGFQDGSSYAYKVHIEAELPDDSVQVYDGNCTYTAKVSRAQPTRKTSQTAFKPTATAFVVSSDGYMVTCHHVVDGAGKLDIAVAGRTYTAQVIETDAANDLAIIKIEATGLKTVPLADSDRVEVGQEVRAIGFPLSSILGDSLKATRGTISGIETRSGRKLLQVDASINPGNSGGPLVNESGEVIGIASAKLAGSSISNVGFAVPINDARRMLTRHNVHLASRQNVSRLEGPALVRSVSPAVALVTVAEQSANRSDGQQIALRFTNSLTSHERQARPQLGRPPRFPRFSPPRMPSPFGFGNAPRNEVVIDSAGNILEASGGESLPFMLGNLAQFMIEPLPSDGERDWETERSCTIHEKKGNDGSPFGPGFVRPPSFGRFGPRFDDEEQVTKHSASEVTEYSVAEPEGDKVVITKQYELKTESQAGESPYLQLTGEGKITFDLKQGIPLEMSYKGAVTVNKQNVSVRIPLTVTYRYLDAAEVAEIKAAAEAKAAEIKAANAPKPLSDEDLDKLLASLDSSNNFDRKKALDKLAKSIPQQQQRAKVAAAVEPLVAHSDSFTRHSALKALSVWGSESNVPAVLKQLDSSDVFTRNNAMAALGALKDARAAAPLCERFKQFQDRSEASAALEKIGAAAEKEVVKLLDEQDWGARMSACQLLAKIGTSDSLPRLQQATQDSNGLVKGTAQSAIDAIKRR
jgi:S1-C subfamily serine protease